MKSKVYDYVIVGAGSAGCTLAYRLGADPSLSVLVIEAGGGDHSPMIKIPLTWGLILKNRLFDWGYFTQSEPGLAERAIECARGKIVGGSSSINGMAYARGAPEDYDGWARDFGLQDWRFEKVLPYFKRSESWQDGESAFRGASGPLHVSRMIYEDPLMDAFFQTTQEMGYPFNPDYNASRIDGFSHLQTTIYKGRRWSAASAYLYPALRRGNLHLMKHALVNKVKLSRGKALGVEVLIHGQVELINAKREVIVCAGVINSPQLLMRSGLGPAAELETHGIKLEVDLPGVGQNLHDHLVCDVRWKRKGQGPLFDVLRLDKIALDVAKTYLFGTGLSGQVPAAAVGHLKSDEALEHADLQLILAAAPMNAAPHFEPFLKAYTDAYALKGIFLSPSSRGQVRLKDKDPRSAPLIEQRFMSTESDRLAITRMIKIMRQMGQSGEFAKFSDGEIFPGPSVQSDEEIERFVALNAITLHHPVGTCKMGLESDPMTVVNSNLQVHGVEQLRVVDGSVMPRIVRGPVNAPIIMMAEKVSDHLLGSA